MRVEDEEIVLPDGPVVAPDENGMERRRVG